jgi:DNA-binding transcriptional ArsR family regulator
MPNLSLDIIKIIFYIKINFYNGAVMQDVYYIEEVDQAMALLKPIRLEILRRLDEPRTCDDLAEVFQDSTQKIYYHVKALQEAGLVEKVADKRIRGTVEGYYQAKARSYWLAPSLVGKIGSLQQTRDQASLRILLQLAEDVIEDTARLGSKSEAGQPVASLSLSAQIHLADSAQRAAFLQELQTTFQNLAMKYGIAEQADASMNFRLVLMCYPKQESRS